jgi:hypothetical protein
MATSFRDHNDPCWCGSGEKYAECHLTRADERRLPPAAVTANVLPSALHKVCLHPQAGPDVCDRIASAHTVQRARVLRELIDSSQHVLHFEGTARTRDDLLPLRAVGWREASTFTGFCARHDAATFAPVEADEFCGTAEQCFLLAYRALCHEVYIKSVSLRAQPGLRRLADQGRSIAEQEGIQHYYDVIRRGASRGLPYLERLKLYMDRELLTHEHASWVNTLVRFNGPLSVATAGVVSPNRDLSGASLQSLSGPEQPLFCDVAIAPADRVIVLSHLSEHEAPRQFLQSILSVPHRVPDRIVQFSLRIWPTRTSHGNGGRISRSISKPTSLTSHGLAIPITPPSSTLI